MGAPETTSFLVAHECGSVGAMRFTRIGICGLVAWLVVASVAACAGAPPPVLRPATATRGLKMCWRAADEGDNDQAKGLRGALTQTLAAAGYTLVGAGSCDFQMQYAWTIESRHPPGWFKQVRIVLRDGRGAYMDKFVLDFSPYTISADQPDPLAILITNGVSDSAKLATVSAGKVVVAPAPPP
jgi:hypothetical protein